MSTNQYRGRKYTGKIDFQKLSPEEQKEYSRTHQAEHDESTEVNEKLPLQKKKKFDEEKARRVR